MALLCATRHWYCRQEMTPRRLVDSRSRGVTAMPFADQWLLMLLQAWARYNQALRGRWYDLWTAPFEQMNPQMNAVYFYLFHVISTFGCPGRSYQEQKVLSSCSSNLNISELCEAWKQNIWHREWMVSSKIPLRLHDAETFIKVKTTSHCVSCWISMFPSMRLKYTEMRSGRSYGVESSDQSCGQSRNWLCSSRLGGAYASLERMGGPWRTSESPKGWDVEVPNNLGEVIVLYCCILYK